uniref:Large ribosomal subunit protein bL20c n=1 Tax=Halophila beccarii TaxID=180123 RepID=A0A7G7YEF2_9LILI|nr:ribosomal protein L20 [Halophila beccarii]QNH92872.1 ribosomal protein L20 [Halophila beccarii]
MTESKDGNPFLNSSKFHSLYSMARTKRGYVARRRRNKTRSFASGFREAHSRLTRIITQQQRKALVYAHRDRRRKKRDFRCLWITRINAATRENELRSYSIFIHDLYERYLLMNRKILAQIAVSNKNFFSIFSNSKKILNPQIKI